MKPQFGCSMTSTPGFEQLASSANSGRSLRCMDLGAESPVVGKERGGSVRNASNKCQNMPQFLCIYTSIPLKTSHFNKMGDCHAHVQQILQYSLRNAFVRHTRNQRFRRGLTYDPSEVLKCPGYFHLFFQAHIIRHGKEQMLEIKVRKLRMLGRNQEDSISIAFRS